MPDIDRWPTGRLLSTAARLVEYGWNEKLEAIGLTHAGVIALEVLSVNGSLTQTQLAHLVRVQAQTMGMTLSRLEAHGHISRQLSRSDRRRHVVSLTQRGREAVDEATAMEQAVLAEASIDPKALRQELQAIVRGLAPRNFSPDAASIATAAEPGLAVDANNPEQHARSEDLGRTRFIGWKVRVSLRASEVVVFDGHAVAARRPRIVAEHGQSA